MKEIKYPIEVTYYIVHDGTNAYAWGSVDSENVLSTSKPHIYQTTDESEWLLELKKFHIVWGYKYYEEESAILDKNKIKNPKIHDSFIIRETKNNDPKFWYVLEDYSDQFDRYVGSSKTFVVLPD